MKYDVIVIGAGIIGLATAERLLQQGINVLILERKIVGNECSWAGGGILSPLIPWNYSQAVTQLTHFSTSLFSEWVLELQETTGIDPEYNRCGMLILPPYDLEKAARWCSQNSVKMDQLTLSSLTTSIEKNKKVISLPNIAQIRNPRLLSALHQRVLQLGGQIVENCEVFNLIVNQNNVSALQTSCGQFIADNYVIAAGAWSKKVLGQYALDLDIKPICGQMLLFKFDMPPIPTVIVKGNTYLIPRKDGHLLVGSTLEDRGFNKQITLSVRKQLLRNAFPILPQLHKMPVKRHWSGLRPASCRNAPTIGQHPNLTNLYVNSGHFRYGITMALGSAKILTKAIIGSPQPFDIDSFHTGWNNTS